MEFYDKFFNQKVKQKYLKELNQIQKEFSERLLGLNQKFVDMIYSGSLLDESDDYSPKPLSKHTSYMDDLQRYVEIYNEGEQNKLEEIFDLIVEKHPQKKREFILDVSDMLPHNYNSKHNCILTEDKTYYIKDFSFIEKEKKRFQKSKNHYFYSFNNLISRYTEAYTNGKKKGMSRWFRQALIYYPNKVNELVNTLNGSLLDGYDEILGELGFYKVRKKKKNNKPLIENQRVYENKKNHPLLSTVDSITTNKKYDLLIEKYKNAYKQNKKKAVSYWFGKVLKEFPDRKDHFFTIIRDILPDNYEEILKKHNMVNKRPYKRKEYSFRDMIEKLEQSYEKDSKRGFTRWYNRITEEFPQKRDFVDNKYSYIINYFKNYERKRQSVGV